MSTGERIRVQCNSCNTSSNHEVVHEVYSGWHEDIEEHCFISGGDTHQVVRCLGCDTISFRHTKLFSENVKPNGEPENEVFLYPPRMSRRKPDWLNDLDTEFWAGESTIGQLLDDIYVALHHDSPRLAGMGTRALLEHIIIEKCGDHGTFANNLEEFRKQGFISTMDEQQLKSVLDVGHAAMHRAFKPSPDHLRTALDIAEVLVARLYVHPGRAARLGESIPARARRAPPAKNSGGGT